MWCCRSDWPGLCLFCCYNPCVLSATRANRVDLGFLFSFHKFPILHPLGSKPHWWTSKRPLPELRACAWLLLMRTGGRARLRTINWKLVAKFEVKHTVNSISVSWIGYLFRRPLQVPRISGETVWEFGPSWLRTLGLRVLCPHDHR